MQELAAGRDQARAFQPFEGCGFGQLAGGRRNDDRLIVRLSVCQMASCIIGTDDQDRGDELSDTFL
jgi:hypothetical protein